MRAEIPLVIALVSILVISAATTCSAAGEEAKDKEMADLNETLSVSVVTGHVRVNVIEWQPRLDGLGTGLFTYSAFDLGEFFSKLAESISELFGL